MCQNVSNRIKTYQVMSCGVTEITTRSSKVCVERRGRESNPQEPLDSVIYKITGLASCPTSPHKKDSGAGIEPDGHPLQGVVRSTRYPGVCLSTKFHRLQTLQGERSQW